MTKNLRLRHYLEYIGLVIIDRILLALPYRVSLRLAKTLGLFAYYLIPIRRRIIRENVRRALGNLPKNESHRILRQSYVNAALTFCEFARMRKMKDEEITRMVESVEGEEYFIEAGSTEKPYLVVTGHLGNWELMGAYFTIKGVPISVIAKPIHNPLVDRYVNNIRHAKGYEVISTREGMKRIVTRIKEGRVIVFLADQDARKTGIFVDFFGLPASTHTGPALFMLRMNLPILPFFDIRTSSGRHKIIFQKPIYPPPEMSKDDAIRWATEQHVRLLEQMVRGHPDQYFWFHRRWKTKPKSKPASKTAKTS